MVVTSPPLLVQRNHEGGDVLATAPTTKRNTAQQRAAFAVIRILALAVALTGWKVLTSSSSAHIVRRCFGGERAGDEVLLKSASGEDRCGLLATFGSASVTAGQKVTVLVSTVDADPETTLSIGTVIPAEFSVR